MPSTEWPTQWPEHLDALRTRLGELDDLGHAAHLLGWDQQTYMPPGGAPARGHVMATVERLHHDRLTEPALGALLDELGPWAAERPADDEAAALVRVVARDHRRARRVPTDLAADIARTGSEAAQVWVDARRRSDFALFQPHLERNVELRRRVADCFADEVEHPYDALLDVYEPEMTTARVREVFADLRAGLVPLIDQIAAAPRPPELPGPFAVRAQQELALEIVRTFGYDDEAWRLDRSEHPFCQSLAPSDIRVTSRFAQADLTGIFAVMHEVGHGLYEHGVDPGLARTTVGTGVSLGMHESQSRLWENFVGRSLPFWRRWHPRLRELIGDAALGGLETDDFFRAINAVQPGPIRVDADEVTYSLHVILRFELELALVEGSLAVAELPEAWNAGMRDMLGVEVPDDARGVLQDIHWAYGELGYFPTYAIGNVVAAQLWAAARADIPDIDDRLEAGEPAALREWLRERVHRFGRTVDPADVLEQATGSRLDPAPLLDHLEAKLGALYGLSASR
jgi:carboxypeptidase Taq